VLPGDNFAVNWRVDIGIGAGKRLVEDSDPIPPVKEITH
jgi:hypothetical protein